MADYQLRDAGGKDVLALPRMEATLGADALDVRQLLPKAKLTTFDPSFNSTASCKSAITFGLSSETV